MNKIILMSVLATLCFTLYAEVLTLNDLKEIALKNNLELLAVEHAKKIFEI